MREDVELGKARINLRLRQSTKELIERAARLSGKTVSNFILSSAVTAAEKSVSSHETMTLQTKDAELFFEALSQKVAFNDTLLDAFEEHEERVTSR